ncbi:MAG: hypothetical protein BWK75_01665 [Candidatus Altiarchaeales archaeon A3]|nr:MAG: hypothetical protein BWK75_01665 [Candidatus Altiarchaeales archaeon A3]
MTLDDAILTYWKSLTGMKNSEIENIKEELIDVANNTYYKHYYRDYPHITIEYYIREGELCEYFPLELYESKLDDDTKKKLIFLMLKNSDKDTWIKYPFHFMADKIIDNDIEKWVNYLVRKDILSPPEIIFKNSDRIMSSKAINNFEKILYYLSLSYVLDKGILFNQYTEHLLNSEFAEGIKADIANLILGEEEIKEFIEKARSLVFTLCVKHNFVKFDFDKDKEKEITAKLKNTPEIVSKDYVVAFNKAMSEIYPSNFGSTKRHVAKWMLSVIHPDQKRKTIIEIMDENDKQSVFGVVDFIQSNLKEFNVTDTSTSFAFDLERDGNFLNNIIDKGISSEEGDIRKLFYILVFVLLDEKDIGKYIDKSREDDAIKVRDALAEVALSVTKYKDIDNERRKKLIEYVVGKKVKLNKKQQNRIKKF